MKVIVSWLILEEKPEFKLCGIVGEVVEERAKTLIIDFGKKRVEVEKRYVQTIRGESLELK
jgi:RNase P/RNase MRP subunit p29